MILNAQVIQIWQLSRKTPKNYHKLVLADRKLKLREIAEELKISEGSVFIILHQHLSMRKLYSKWVLSLLTVDQNQQHVDDSKRCLQPFQRNKKEFLHKYVTRDETSSLWNQIGSQLCGQQQVKAVQSDQRRKHQQARLVIRILGYAKYFVHRLPWERKKY